MNSTDGYFTGSISGFAEAFTVNSTGFTTEAFTVNSTGFTTEAFTVNSTGFPTEAFTVNSTGFTTEAFTVNSTGFTTEAFTVNNTGFTNDISAYFYYDYPDEDFGRCVYEHHAAHFIPPLYAIFFLLGILGNSLVIWVIVCGVRLRSMTDVCLLNLAIADLLLVCSLPFLAHQAREEWVFGDAMCKVVLGTYHIVFYCGIFFICLMSIDRYLAIVHAVYALKARTRSFGMVAAAVTWVAGFLSSFPELIYLEQQKSANMSYQCFPAYPAAADGYENSLNPHFWRVFGLLKMNIVGLFVPLFIMSFCYSQIIWRLLYSHSSKKQAIQVVLVVVAVFFCCWVPYNIASFFKALDLLHIYTGCERSKAIRLALQVTEAIAYSHSCLNPILYVFVGEKFRRQLLRLMSRASCRLCQVIKVYMPQDMITASVYSQNTSMDERSTGL
ncbi:C-C chemokine receptor type 5-like isoform 1-T1 [Menidia menidia]